MSKTLGKMLGVVMVAMLASALLVPMAQAAKPKPPWERFAGCPSEKENPKSLICIRNEITGGYFQMGSKNVPITNKITVVGGVDENFGNFSYNSEGGMSKSPQTVPGGVIGLTGLTWLLEFFGVNALSLYATTEPAGIPNLNPFEEPIELPVKVHLTTPSGVLGNNCYVGSVSSPINLNLIVGTTSPPAPNKPITGKAPTVTFEPSGLIKFLNGTFVDNSFSAPGASGCVLTLFGFIPISINGLVNAQSGLPSAAGKNATAMNFNIETLESATVYP